MPVTQPSQWQKEFKQFDQLQQELLQASTAIAQS
jgi:hypothetical protein